MVIDSQDKNPLLVLVEKKMDFWGLKPADLQRRTGVSQGAINRFFNDAKMVKTGSIFKILDGLDLLKKDFQHETAHTNEPADEEKGGEGSTMENMWQTKYEELEKRYNDLVDRIMHTPFGKGLPIEQSELSRDLTNRNKK